MVRERYANVRMDSSRLDSATALYLRCAGYSMEAVDRELMRHSPRPATEDDRNDSLERRTRILQYAYGTAGDIDIAATHPTLEQVQRFIADAEQKEQDLQNAIEQQNRLRTGDPATAYCVHVRHIRQHMPRIEDGNLDAMIALRMRSNGHSRETIAKTIHTLSPAFTKDAPPGERQHHAERIAEYAFGLQGTHDMMRNKTYWPIWRKVEGVEEQQREEAQPVWRMR